MPVIRNIAHLSDTHILPTEADRLHGVDTFDNLERVLQRLSAGPTSFDAIVVSGDLADGGEAESYRRLRALLHTWGQQLAAPVILAMGNHDARPAFHQELLDEAPTQAPVDYVTWIGGLRVIVIDSSIPGSAQVTSIWIN
jgi:3',5'-cyclic AMP phosphodiesterase CpdA